MYASKLGNRPDIHTKRERIELSDGDFLDINQSLARNGPIVCLFHGLAGCIESAYIKGVLHALEAQGMRPVLMHWRGCSGEPNRLARSYHSGASDDIRTMISWLQQQYPATPLMAVGFSLGGNALLKYLGEEGESCVLAAAVSVCPPLLLHIGANKLNQGLTRGYQHYLLSLMKGQHEAKRQRYPELELPEASHELDNFWKFDDAVTAPLHGFSDVHDYYSRCSARQFVPGIRVPTHIIYALDDPFFTPEVLPNEGELGRHVTLELPRHGGHVGFVSGNNPVRPYYWLDKRVADILSCKL